MVDEDGTVWLWTGEGVCPNCGEDAGLRHDLCILDLEVADRALALDEAEAAAGEMEAVAEATAVVAATMAAAEALAAVARSWAAVAEALGVVAAAKDALAASEALLFAAVNTDSWRRWAEIPSERQRPGRPQWPVAGSHMLAAG